MSSSYGFKSQYMSSIRIVGFIIHAYNGVVIYPPKQLVRVCYRPKRSISYPIIPGDSKYHTHDHNKMYSTHITDSHPSTPYLSALLFFVQRLCDQSVRTC
jgi:hypothetical protein